MIDECTRECLALFVDRRITSNDVIAVLSELFIERGAPEHLRSDNGPEFCSRAIRRWLSDLGVGTLFIEPGSLWENGYNESFNGKLRDEVPDQEIFHTLAEAKAVIEAWRIEYDTIRPHSAQGYRAPVPETVVGPDSRIDLDPRTTDRQPTTLEVGRSSGAGHKDISRESVAQHATLRQRLKRSGDARQTVKADLAGH